MGLSLPETRTVATALGEIVALLLAVRFRVQERIAVVVGGTKVSFPVRGTTQRMRFHNEPALSFVPLAREPPNGCWPDDRTRRLVVDVEVPAGVAELVVAPPRSRSARSRRRLP
jgi:hypothetical protein